MGDNLSLKCLNSTANGVQRSKLVRNKHGRLGWSLTLYVISREFWTLMKFRDYKMRPASTYVWPTVETES